MKNAIGVFIILDICVRNLKTEFLKLMSGLIEVVYKISDVVVKDFRSFGGLSVDPGHWEYS